MAKGWKRVVEAAIARSGVARHAERRRRPAAIVLAYHNIVPEGEKPAGDLSLHVDQRTFADQLDWLLEGRRVVSLEDALDEPGPLETRIAITFDDAYRGTLTAGAEELSKRGLPSTVFVPPGLLGSRGFWWDLLAREGAVLDPEIRSHVLDGLRGETDRIVRWAQEERLPLQDLPSHARPVEEASIASGEHPEGMSFGAHTWSHPNLARLSRAEALVELTTSKAWLSERTTRYADWLAYPYGLVSSDARAAAEQVFSGALLVDGGPALMNGRMRGARHVIPRVNVPRGLSIDGLALRISALLGA